MQASGSVFKIWNFVQNVSWLSKWTFLAKQERWNRALQPTQALCIDKSAQTYKEIWKCQRIKLVITCKTISSHIMWKQGWYETHYEVTSDASIAFSLWALSRRNHKWVINLFCLDPSMIPPSFYEDIFHLRCCWLWRCNGSWIQKVHLGVPPSPPPSPTTQAVTTGKGKKRNLTLWIQVF